MKYSAWIILNFCMSAAIMGQQDYFTVFDTVRLEEITVSTTVPLDDRTILDLHQSSRFSSIDRINARLDGISLIRRGAYALEPQMHGFSAGQINLMVDGMKMFGACTDKMDPVTSYVEPHNLKGLSITHGTNGSIYGGTTGGAFNMLLKEPGTGELKKSTFLGGLGYESISGGMTANGALEISRSKFALRTSGSYRKHSNYTDGNGNSVPFSQYEKINLHSVVKYIPDPDNVFRLDFLLDDAYDIGYTALPMDVAMARARIYALGYEKPGRTAGITGFKSKIYYNSVYHLMDDSRRDSTFFLDARQGSSNDTVYMRMDMPGWSNTWGFYMQGRIGINEKNSLFLKIDEYLNSSRANMTMYMNQPGTPGEPPMYAETWPDMLRNVTGIYTSFTHEAGSRTRLSLNARLDYSTSRVTSETGWKQFHIFAYNIERDYIELPKSLNVNLSHKSNSFLRFNMGAGYSERLPANSEQFGFFLYNALDGYDYLGNPDLRLEQSKQVWNEIHFSWPGIKISLRNQFSYVKDYILGRVDTEIPPLNLYAAGLKVYGNIDYAILFGSGLQARWQPLDQLSFYTLSNYTWARTHMDDPLPLIPPIKSLNIIRYSSKLVAFQAEGEFASSQNRISQDFGEVPTPGYSLFHLRLSYLGDLLDVPVELSTGIENIFDTPYREHLDWGSYLRPGRNLYLHLSINI